MRPGEPALEAVFFKVLLVLKAWTLTLNVEIGLSKSRVFCLFGLLTRACGLKCRGADRFRLDPWSGRGRASREAWEGRDAGAERAASLKFVEHLWKKK